MELSLIRQIISMAIMVACGYLLVSYLAMIAPSAATVMMMASVYKKDAAYASAINALTTVVSAFTIPLMVALYLRIM